MKSLNKKNKKGFALLFSVLISSLLLTIGLSIFSITLKELSISTYARQSVHAFYAADSGRECIKYWDTKRGKIPDLFFASAEGVISCGESDTITVTGTYNPAIGYLTATSSVVDVRAPSAGEISIDLEGSNFYVEVSKSIANRGTVNQSATTTIVSYGQDSVGGERVQRAIEQTY